MLLVKVCVVFGLFEYLTSLTATVIQRQCNKRVTLVTSRSPKRIESVVKIKSYKRQDGGGAALKRKGLSNFTTRLARNFFIMSTLQVFISEGLQTSLWTFLQTLV